MYFLERILSFAGVFLLILLLYMFSTARSKIEWRLILIGMLFQFMLVFFVFKTDLGLYLADGVQFLSLRLVGFSRFGATYLFGDNFRSCFALNVLPAIIFFSCLMSILFYFGILQHVIKFFAMVMYKTLKISGAEALVASANMFFGVTAAPFVVLPYLKNMTSSEMFVVMVSGLATIGGGVFAAYVNMGFNATHLVCATAMSVPAALITAKLLVPETETPDTVGDCKLQLHIDSVNMFDAACKGAERGLRLALTVMAMLIAFVSVIALVNSFFGIFRVGGDTLSLQRILGYVFFPVGLFMGVEWKDIMPIAQVLGIKIIAGDFIGFLELSKCREMISERSFVIGTYALCGFANLPTIGLLIGGVGGLVPSKRAYIAKMGFKAMIAGALASVMTACIAGIFL